MTFRTDKLTADGGIVADVTVTNTGDMAGKDVVQLYYCRCSMNASTLDDCKPKKKPISA